MAKGKSGGSSREKFNTTSMVRAGGSDIYTAAKSLAGPVSYEPKGYPQQSGTLRINEKQSGKAVKGAD